MCLMCIVLAENDKVVSDDTNVAETFNTFIDDTVKNLGITGNQLLLNKVVNSEDKVNDAIKMYEAHPSFIKIIEQHRLKHNFHFLALLMMTFIPKGGP